MIMATGPQHPPPYSETLAGPESEAEQDTWEAAISAFVMNIVIFKLSPGTTPAQLLALFAAPEYQPLLFYYACADLLRATREFSDADEHLALLAALFRLLKEEGLKRDDREGEGVFGNAVVFPTLRALAGDIPAPPGYKYDRIVFALVPDPNYVKDDVTAFMAGLAEYAREHEGMVRLWTLVGRLEADRVLGEPGSMSLRFHQGSRLLSALEDPTQRGVWETLWAGVGHCDDEMTYGAWGEGTPDGLGSFKDAVKIIADERAGLSWRARFALILEELEKERC
ncbi:hypothetical protein C8R43DRAFT_586417 [Mycena crocata]|nr:hypothetical protein C8R43DRAFT_586417 [Mycena crocata]